MKADPALEIELSCEDPTSQKDWVTNEVYFGPLTDGGLLIDVPLHYSQILVDRRCEIFDLLGQYLKPFESCVGVNGRAYIRAGDNSHLRASLVAQILARSSNLKPEEVTELCQDAERRLSQ